MLCLERRSRTQPGGRSRYVVFSPSVGMESSSAGRTGGGDGQSAQHGNLISLFPGPAPHACIDWARRCRFSAPQVCSTEPNRPSMLDACYSSPPQPKTSPAPSLPLPTTSPGATRILSTVSSANLGCATTLPSSYSKLERITTHNIEVGWEMNVMRKQIDSDHRIARTQDVDLKRRCESRVGWDVRGGSLLRSAHCSFSTGPRQLTNGDVNVGVYCMVFAQCLQVLRAKHKEGRPPLVLTFTAVCIFVLVTIVRPPTRRRRVHAH